jgi:propionyl-CoA synthetase
VRHDVGPIARLEAILYVHKVPKTRSGKILRGTLKKIVNREEYKLPATIDDASCLDDIKSIAFGWLDAKAAAL